MPGPQAGSEDDAEAGVADPQAPVHVLEVREELLVEQADALDRLP